MLYYNTNHILFQIYFKRYKNCDYFQTPVIAFVYLRRIHQLLILISNERIFNLPTDLGYIYIKRLHFVMRKIFLKLFSCRFIYCIYRRLVNIILHSLYMFILKQNAGLCG